MACTKEEIERKRLAALQKRQNKAQDQNKSIVSSPSPISTPSPRTPLRQSWAGPVRNSGNFGNGNRTFHPYAKPESSVPVTKVVSGTVYLISEERFEVNPSEFCPPLINVFKSIPSKSYDPSSKLWNFSINDYQELMSKVAPLAPHIVLGALPQFVLKILRTQITDPRTLDLSPIEATLRNKLMPFQEDGVRFGIAHRGRCMIADDMGLGKTFQALAIASYYKHNFPLLVVTTSSMRETWQSKIHELLPTIPMMNIITLSSNKDAQLVADRQTQVVIVSYKMVTIHKDLLRDKKFGVVIIDESHQVKTPNAKCTLALKSISKLSARMILLSGTPALSRPIELYTQLELIEPKLFNSYNEYGKRYCAAKQTNFGWDMTGQSNLAELQVILQKRFLIRRTKEEVLTELEQKTRESVLLDETLLEFTKEDKTGLTQMAESYRSSRASERHTALLNFFSESARVKIPAICKYIRQLLSCSTDKFLVFAHHRAVIDAICSTLDEEEAHYICITGSTPTNARAFLVFAHHRAVIDAICSTLDEEEAHYICITGSTPTNARAFLVFAHHRAVIDAICSTLDEEEAHYICITGSTPTNARAIRQLLSCSTDKFLVFAHHRAVIDAICSTLDEEEAHYICITGSTPTNARAFLVFAHHRAVIDAICSTLDEEEAHYICITGSTPTNARAFLVFAHHRAVIDAICSTLDEDEAHYICITGSTPTNARAFLVFAHHRAVIDAICSTLDEEEAHYICITGSTPTNARAFLVFAHHRAVIDAICSTLDEEEAHYICITGATPTNARAFLVFAHHRAVIDAICSTLDEEEAHYICITGSTPTNARAYKYIRQLLSCSTDKFLVFAHHRAVIDAICSTLDEEEAHYICITGATPTNARADLVDKFQYVESCRCGVLSITAANSGLTLTAAKLVLFAELHWNPGILTQAESRAHRIGQQGGVCARYLLARGTCDDYMWPMLQGKLNVLNNVGLSGDSFEGTTTKHQEGRTNITQYLSPKCPKNPNDYIPGTNIRKDSQKTQTNKNNNSSFTTLGDFVESKNPQTNKNNNSSFTTLGDIGQSFSTTLGDFDEPFDTSVNDADMTKSFLDDDEGDELLAALDL
ncbi:SWI/SNF-related matrix-associated actin-dependent regulator of chromatin subfamily A-like protein 1 [Cydia fagiglandana]|uniref:SWI/SNF-related matrix-associated actin-dependent regulator of chromatin subfamily A-like protein 1 n=1 Tax=Cydia fagiglandana TaxID=1458189 RepID=UPI002FEE4E15